MYISPINFARDFYAFVCNQGFYAIFGDAFYHLNTGSRQRGVYHKFVINQPSPDLGRGYCIRLDTEIEINRIFAPKLMP